MSDADDDFRVALARKTLTESQQADPGTAEAARWWGTLEHTVETLLAVIAEGRS